jgi:hypothetical protein
MNPGIDSASYVARRAGKTNTTDQFLRIDSWAPEAFSGSVNLFTLHEEFFSWDIKDLADYEMETCHYFYA